MSAPFKVARVCRCAVGVLVAMSLSLGVASAEPDGGDGSSSGSGSDGASSGSTDSGSSSGTSGGSGTATGSTGQVAEDKQALSADVDKLSDLAAQMDAEMGGLSGDLLKFEQDGGSTADLLQLQMQLRQLSQQTQTWSTIARERAEGITGVVPKTG